MYGAFVWARRALNNQKRRFPARAAAQGFLDLHRAEAAAEQTCQPRYDGTYDLGMLVGEANAVLERHPSGADAPPLFLYLALHSVHAPEEVPASWEAPYAAVPNGPLTPRRTMCGMVACMDDGIGRLVAHWSTVRGEAWWNNTILFFHRCVCLMKPPTQRTVRAVSALN